ncbi:MAG: MFS transporter, partial [Armatimonadota bacterium]
FSLTGTWMQNIAQGWLVQRIVRQEMGDANLSLYLGIVAARASAPMLLFSLFAGVLADRADKRRILVITQSCAAVLALLLGMLTGTDLIRLWHVMVLATLLGTVNAFDMPTRQAFVKDMVGPKDLLNAIALNSSVFNGARILGPAVAGALIAIPRIGISGAFYINAASYLAVIAGLLAIRLAPAPRPTATGTVWQHLREGLRYALTHRLIRLILLLMAVYSIFGFSYFVLIPAYVTQVLGSNTPVTFGTLVAMGGVGALAGALLVATLAGKVPKGRLLLWAGFVYPMALLVFSQSRHFLPAGIALIFVGGGLVVSSASINSLIQETVPDALRGRVISIWAFIFAGFMPVGALYIGALAHFTSIPFALFLSGAFCLGMIILLRLAAPWVWRIP